MRLVLVLLVAAGLSIAPAAVPDEPHVILITIDGMAAYNLDDPDLVIPNIRELARTGVRAESSETIFPSLTHPSHTTIVTGVSPIVHGVLGNSMYDRTAGKKFDVSEERHADIVHAPTIFDAAKEKGLVTAAFDWPESKEDPSVDYNLPDTSHVNAASAKEFTDPELALRFDPKYHHDPVYQGTTDLMLAEAAAETIRRHRPNLLAIHFLKTDVVQHTYGPGHYLARAAITETDRHIGLLREAVRKAGLESSTTFIVTADHGFQAVYEEIGLYAPFADAGLAGKVRLNANKWMLFVERSKSFQPEDEPHLAAVLARVAALPGIHRVVPSSQFPELGQPRYEDDVHVRGQYMILANLEYHLSADPKVSSTAPYLKKTPYFGHGYLPQNPRMYPMLVLEGRSIAAGKRIGHVRHIDLAPTIACLLSLDWNQGPGRVLTEALSKP